jgi:23S rRNA U2552 (ribose-2'-O)-methylase RlmE/FtsJ
MKRYRLGSHEKQIVVSETKETYEDMSKSKLIETKSLIDQCPIKLWEKSKKQHNDYEYIYTSSKKDMNVCSINPVSRSYFKLYEMIKDFHLIKSNIFCACLAEGPGGFIHCLNDLSYRQENLIHRCYGITLYSSDRKIPYWNQMIIKNKKNILSYGEDKTGDLYKLNNAKHFIKHVGNNFCHLVTADGGFDYSEDYNQQEISSYKLLYSEIYVALHIQSQTGNFVLKVFDLFNYQTIQLIYVLYTCYSIVEFYKPLTSRLSNSEKYVICSGFTGCSDEFKELLTTYYEKCETLFLKIPDSFLDEMSKYNELFTQSQIKKIKEILSSCQQETIQLPMKGQIENAKRWCELYKLPINKHCIYFR